MTGRTGWRVGRRWLVGGLVAAVAGTAVTLAVMAPMPASSGPSGAGVSGDESRPHTHITMDSMADMPGMSGHGGAVPVGGTAASAGGYTFVPDADDFTPGEPADFRFHIEGPDGQPVTNFARVHDKLLHLVIVRHDLSGFQHVHPILAPDGTWSIRLTFAAPGTYRAYADFTAIDAKGTANAVVLGLDIPVAGTAPAVPLPAAATTSAVDGFTVGYEGAPSAGVVEPLLFDITRDGRPVDLEHYLDAFGHLVVIRQDDLGYLHIHPEAALVDGKVKFWAAIPGPGTYRMYLDFQVAGAVHTAEFTLTVG